MTLPSNGAMGATKSPESLLARVIVLVVALAFNMFVMVTCHWRTKMILSK